MNEIAYSRTPRGRCPVCHWSIRLKDGKFVPHARPVPTHFKNGVSGTMGLCPGSGRAGLR